MIPKLDAALQHPIVVHYKIERWPETRNKHKLSMLTIVSSKVALVSTPLVEAVVDVYAIKLPVKTYTYVFIEFVN